MATIRGRLKPDRGGSVHDVAENEEPSARAGPSRFRRLSLRAIKPSEEARAEVYLELPAGGQDRDPGVRRCAFVRPMLRPGGLTGG
jgi:hypothetical protein